LAMFEFQGAAALYPGLCARCPVGARSFKAHPSYVRTIM